MKKTVFFLAPIIFVVLAISCKIETNYSEDEHYGKVIVHNEASSGQTIARIGIFVGSTAYYNEKVTLAPGNSSNAYELELGSDGHLFNRYRVTVTLDDSTTKTLNISAYEDIVNNLYFDGTDLVERK